jgi:hypothetical protein
MEKNLVDLIELVASVTVGASFVFCRHFYQLQNYHNQHRHIPSTINVVLL